PPAASRARGDIRARRAGALRSVPGDRRHADTRPRTMSDWRDLFCGRGAELTHLREAYEAVASGYGARFVVVLGDRGMGKTRLVREFYSYLTRECDPDGYWPEASLFQGRNLLVGP